MKELVRTNNPVLISYLQDRLQQAEIGAWVLDGHTSVLEGSIGALPRRLMVEDERFADAKVILAEAEALLKE